MKSASNPTPPLYQTQALLIGCSYASRLFAVLLLALPQVLHAQFSFTTNADNTINIMSYSGPGGSVTIPSSINGLPVTSIGVVAFLHCTTLTSVTIPDSVTSIGMSAFSSCSSLTNVIMGNQVITIAAAAFGSCKRLTGVTLPDTVTNIGDFAFDFCSSLTSIRIPSHVTGLGQYAFHLCSSLTNATIGNDVTIIGDYAFDGCSRLTSLTLPSSVSTIGDGAFYGCSKLKAVYYEGDAPSLGGTNVFGADTLTVFYLPGTAGWSSPYGGRPTAVWALPNPRILNNRLGVQTNGFSFTISWATNLSVMVEASTHLAGAGWTSLQTCTLTNGSFNFSDPQWTDYTARFYRIRSP